MSESPAELSSRRAERKRQLAAELLRARTSLSRHGSELAASADVGARLKRSFASGPVLWVGGALLAGAAVSAALLWRRKKVVKVETKVLQLPWGRAKETDTAAKTGAAAGVLSLVTSLVMPIVRPMLMSWIQDKLRGKRGR